MKINYFYATKRILCFITVPFQVVNVGGQTDRLNSERSKIKKENHFDCLVYFQYILVYEEYVLNNYFEMLTLTKTHFHNFVFSVRDLKRNWVLKTMLLHGVISLFLFSKKVAFLNKRLKPRVATILALVEILN